MTDLPELLREMERHLTLWSEVTPTSNRHGDLGFVRYRTDQPQIALQVHGVPVSVDVALISLQLSVSSDPDSVRASTSEDGGWLQITQSMTSLDVDAYIAAEFDDPTTAVAKSLRSQALVSDSTYELRPPRGPDSLTLLVGPAGASEALRSLATTANISTSFKGLMSLIDGPSSSPDPFNAATVRVKYRNRVHLTDDVADHEGRSFISCERWSSPVHLQIVDSRHWPGRLGFPRTAGGPIMWAELILDDPIVPDLPVVRIDQRQFRRKVSSVPS